MPVTESNPEKSKMGLYKIKDNFINFWFKFVYPNRSYLESGYTDVVMNKLKNSFISNHAAFVYEEICRNVCMRKMAAEDVFEFFPIKSADGGTERILKLTLSLSRKKAKISFSVNVNIQILLWILTYITNCSKKKTWLHGTGMAEMKNMYFSVSTAIRKDFMILQKKTIVSF